MSRVKKDKSNEFGFDSASEKNIKDGTISAREVIDAREKAFRLLEEAQYQDKDKITVEVRPGTWIRVKKGDDVKKAVKRFKDRTGIKN
ncbi:hypothetical protein ACR75N_04720 [Parabacteroides merdae]|uniref:hypothetical protein n=1 Tax=Parabacteroides merdae TaxID=46503 RepID=UPI003DA5AD8D